MTGLLPRLEGKQTLAMRRAVLIVPLLLAGLFADVADAAPPAGLERRALLIGIDVHQGNTRTNVGSKGDVEDMKALLVRSGWSPSNIRTLTDGGAKASDIREGLSWLARTSTENTFSVISYAGHVRQEGRTESLWPSDNQWIPDTELAASLRQVKGWLWAHISGCEAAGFDEGISGPKRLITASSLATQKSYELPSAGNSMFTYLMIDAGMLKGQGDRNKDGRVSIQEAFAYADPLAYSNTTGQAQGPQDPQILGGDGTEWFLQGPPTAASSGWGGTRCSFLCLK